MVKKLEQFSVEIFPYYISKEEGPIFFLEMKSDDYFTPYFNNSLNPFGGNWKNTGEKYVHEILEEELKEEFHIIEEYEDNMNNLFHNKLVEHQQYGKEKRLIQKENITEEIKKIPSILLEGNKYIGSYTFTFFPPLLKEELTAGASVFIKNLSDEEYKFINEILISCDNLVTTDNFKYKGSKTLFASLGDINENKYRFAWGWEHPLIYLLEQNKLPLADNIPLKIKILNNIKVEPIEEKSLIKKIGSANGPTFRSFERLGYKFDMGY